MIHLYSDSRCPFSHRARIVLNKKDMDFNIIDVGIESRQDLMIINPKNEAPVLVDDIDKNNRKKDLILTQPDIICEYIDERFPHPQLMPIEPAEKARLRMIMFNIEHELFQHLRFYDVNFFNRDPKFKKDLEQAKQHIIAALDVLAQIFVINKKAEYLFGNSFSLLDAAILPLLWRLSYYEIELKSNWQGLMGYAKRMFQTKEFIDSLTPAERGIGIA